MVQYFVTFAFLLSMFVLDWSSSKLHFYVLFIALSYVFEYKKKPQSKQKQTNKTKQNKTKTKTISEVQGCMQQNRHLGSIELCYISTGTGEDC